MGKWEKKKWEEHIGEWWKRKKAEKRKYIEGQIGIHICTDYGRPESKYPSLHGRKFNANPKFLGTAAAILSATSAQFFQISLIYAFIGCP